MELTQNSTLGCAPQKNLHVPSFFMKNHCCPFLAFWYLFLRSLLPSSTRRSASTLPSSYKAYFPCSALIHQNVTWAFPLVPAFLHLSREASLNSHIHSAQFCIFLALTAPHAYHIFSGIAKNLL